MKRSRTCSAEIDVRDADWRLGNYQILEEIGRGGMGVIYRARQRHSRRIVAVKRILSYHADSQETLARFRREAEAAASLDHPNILPIYEVSESEDGLPFFSMKFAAGGSLLEAAPALRSEPRRAVALMAKVARAVQYAHIKGILHRDLKPGNIMLDGHGEPLVSDFGLAKWLDITSDLTHTLTIFGTPGYIAPEQANGSAAETYTGGGCLQSGRDLVQSFNRPAAIFGRARAGGDPTSLRETRAETAHSVARRWIAIWKQFVQNVWSANPTRVIAPPAIWPKTSNVGSKAATSSRVPSRRRRASGAGRDGIQLLRQWPRSSLALGTAVGVTDLERRIGHPAGQKRNRRAAL